MKKVDLKKLVEFIIAYCNIHGFIITPMKLQKILYYIQSWHLVKYDKVQLFDELPQAWVNGPVYRSVYDMYRDNFYRSTSLFLNELEDANEDIINKYKDNLNIEGHQIDTITTILKHYSPLEEGKLVLMTHNDAPWNIAREGFGDFDRCVNKITADSMFEFYNSKTSK